MTKISALVVLTCTLTVACKYESAADGNLVNPTEFRTLPSNAEVLAKSYDSTYDVPSGFYVDERAGTPGSYSIYHVKDASSSYELCTDDFTEAQDWEAADDASRAVNGTYVTSIETAMYFEFVRELSYPDGTGNVPGPTSPGFSRVFKCSYINRDGADRNLRDGYAGSLNARPLSEEAIARYSEYMWQFTFFWPAQKKVLDTYSAETSDGYSNTLLLSFVTNQGNDSCDLVQVVEWEFFVDRNSGQLSKRFQTVYQFEAKLENGVPQECGN